MKVSIHQPEFLPYLGFWNKIFLSDIFVILDTAQFNKGQFQNRNRIEQNDSWRWITVPLIKTNHKDSIRNKLIDNNQKWQKKHLNLIYTNYRKYPFFYPIFDELQTLYKKRYEYLINLNIDLFLWIIKNLKINTKIIFASDLDINENAKGTLLNYEICKKLNANIYISGAFGNEYLDTSVFINSGILVKFQEFPQNDRVNLSILDSLFKYGWDDTLKLIQNWYSLD